MATKTPTPRNPDDGGEPDPRKLTDRLIVAVVELLLAGNFRQVAAQRVGVGQRTFWRWMALGKRYPKGIYGRLRQAVLRAEAEAESRAIRAVLDAGTTVDAIHLEWFLERKFPERWGRYRGELVELRKRVQDLEREVAVREAANRAAGKAD